MATATNNNIARAIYAAVAGKTKSESHAILKNVPQFLYKRRLLNKAPDILERLEKIINTEEGRIVAKVSSTTALKSSDEKEIINALRKRYGAKEVELLPNADASLLGGFKVEIGDEVIDLTIKNRIEKLKEFLIKSYE